MELDERLARAMGTVLSGSVWQTTCTQKPLPDEYMVLTTVDNRPEIYSGDQDEQLAVQYRVAWYRRGDTSGCARRMRSAARNAGFLIESTPPESYDPATGHKIVYIEVSATDTCEDYSET